jgi:outer membrane protein OmpA-like peptidoglycan-associated protein
MSDDDFGGEGAGPWPAFADLLSATTLLFLVLFAAIAAPALRVAKGARERESRILAIESQLRRVAKDQKVEVQRVGDYLLVKIAGDATFPQKAYTLASLKPEGKQILRGFGTFLQSDSLLGDIDQVQVVGHASAEGGDEENWRLSASRAATVSLFLIDSVRMPPCQVSAMGRSRYYPVNTDSARAGVVDPADRRIELEVRPVIPNDTNQQIRRGRCVDHRGGS